MMRNSQSNMDAKTHVCRIVLVQLGHFLGLAHDNEEALRTVEQALLGPQIILPSRREMRQALVEELAINFNLGHGVVQAVVRAERLRDGKKNNDGEKR